MSFVNWKVTENYFNPVAVTSAVQRTAKSNLMRAGAFVRLTARRSIKPGPFEKKTKRSDARKLKDTGGKRRRKVSKPGSPPRLHTRRTSRNLKYIRFDWVASSQSVIVGPVKFTNKSGINIPGVLEHGGSSRVRVTSNNRGRKRVRRKSIRVAARPFMQPALEDEAPNFAKIWADSIRK